MTIELVAERIGRHRYLNYAESHLEKAKRGERAKSESEPSVPAMHQNKVANN